MGMRPKREQYAQKARQFLKENLVRDGTARVSREAIYRAFAEEARRAHPLHFSEYDLSPKAFGRLVTEFTHTVAEAWVYGWRLRGRGVLTESVDPEIRRGRAV